MTSHPRDPLAVVEAAYELHLPESLWLEGILRAALPLLDDGHGAIAFAVDLGAPDGAMLRSPVALGGSREWEARWREAWERVLVPMPRDILAAAVGFGPVFHSSEATDALASQLPTIDLYLEEMRRRGVERVWGREWVPPRSSASDLAQVIFPDTLNVQGTDPSGHSIVLTGNRAEVATRPPARTTIRSWTRIAAHVAAAHRVRRKLGELGLIDGAEAVIAPGGTIVHAEGAAKRPQAREALRKAAIAVDHARTEAVRDTDDALEMWRALHVGRWSVLDSFDSDGRRFIVARENEPAASPAPALSRREQQVLDLLALGHSNKAIAYDLGISVSSVATHLRRAAAKLGVVGTRELVRWARARPRPREAE